MSALDRLGWAEKLYVGSCLIPNETANAELLVPYSSVKLFKSSSCLMGAITSMNLVVVFGRGFKMGFKRFYWKILVSVLRPLGISWLSLIWWVNKNAYSFSSMNI